MKILLEAIINNLSGERTKKIVGELANFHRIQASKEFLDSLNYIREKIGEFTDNECKILEYKADGKKNYYDWSTPISWDINNGELAVIEPFRRILCRFDEVPESICTHSKPVDLTAEIVHVGGATDKEIEGKELKGKIVLTTGRPRSLINKINEIGAIGLIAYPSEERAKGYYEMIQYVGLWPKAENIDKSTFGFSISRKQALELISLLDVGKKVIVSAKIDAELYEGKMHVLTTKIEGSKYPDEEIILIAHICHPAPSANDNASGSSLLLEIYKIISKLIQNKTIEKPHRSIRFLWVPEFHGTIPWIKENAETGRIKPIICINLDMVGEHPGIVGYPFTFSKSSISKPSFLNDLIIRNIEIIKDREDLIEQSGWQFPWNYRIQPFSGGSDHILFNDEPFRIPSVMFGHSDTFHHTNLDTIDKVDPTTLKRIGVLTTITALLVAYEDGYSEEIMKAYLEGYQQRKGKITNLVIDAISSEKHDKKTIMKILDNFELFEKEIVEQITRLFKPKDIKRHELVQTDLNHFSLSLQRIISEKNFCKNENKNNMFSKTPIRKWEGPLEMSVLSKVLEDEEQIKKELELSEEDVQKIKNLINENSSNYGGGILEIVNLINDKRDIEQIAANLTMSDWRINDIDKIYTFLIYLQKLGIIEMRG